MRTLTVVVAILSFLSSAWIILESHEEDWTGPLPGDGSTYPDGSFKPAPPCRLAPDRTGELVAVAYVTERKPDRRGFGAPIRGEIAINGHCYPFVSGGHGRGSIPFGTYRVGAAMNRPYLNPNAGHTAYPISDVFDPIAKDTRSALFIHPGRSTAGCIGIDPDQWEQFERDMRATQPRHLDLVASRKQLNS